MAHTDAFASAPFCGHMKWIEKEGERVRHKRIAAADRSKTLSWPQHSLCQSTLRAPHALTVWPFHGGQSPVLWTHTTWEEESTKGVSGTRTAGQAKTKKCNPGQFVWHIEWMLAVHSFYHTFGLTAHSFSFLSCPHTVAARDLWSCVWEKERKRNGECHFFFHFSFFFLQACHMNECIVRTGLRKRKERKRSVTVP